MVGLDDNTVGIEQVDGQRHEDWIHSVLEAKLPPSSNTRIHKVPATLREHKDYDKYYVPKMVSLGPYHHGNPKLEPVQTLKPVFTSKLVSGNKATLESLYNRLAQMVQPLREYYEEKWLSDISDDDFTRMMLLDGCFVMYFIGNMFHGNEKDCLGMKFHQTVYIQQDLLLLENQVPFRVLTEVMSLVRDRLWEFKIHRFIDDHILATEKRRRGWFRLPYAKPVPNEPAPAAAADHLLHLLQRRLTTQKSTGASPNGRYTFRNVNELLEVGINFKASKVRSLGRIEFSGHGFFASLKLPPITVDDATKPLLLNLMAYEMCSDEKNGSWVTSYICLLDSLIDHAEDVRVLRKAGVLDNHLGSDKQVAQLFNEIGTDLVPNDYAFSDARFAIQKHYDSKRNTWVRQLKHEYIKSPWAFIALVGGVVALFLSAVQAYFSVWSPEGECDRLCALAKTNGHE